MTTEGQSPLLPFANVREMQLQPASARIKTKNAHSSIYPSISSYNI
jgi:hypothetical protein